MVSAVSKKICRPSGSRLSTTVVLLFQTAAFHIPPADLISWLPSFCLYGSNGGILDSGRPEFSGIRPGFQLRRALRPEGFPTHRLSCRRLKNGRIPIRRPKRPLYCRKQISQLPADKEPNSDYSFHSRLPSHPFIFIPVLSATNRPGIYKRAQGPCTDGTNFPFPSSFPSDRRGSMTRLPLCTNHFTLSLSSCCSKCS